MSAFSEIWNNEVKALAEACVAEPKFVQLMMKGEGYEMTKEEEKYFEKVRGKYLDPYGMCYISDMIFRVERDLAEGRDWQAECTIISAYSNLSETSLFQDVFKGDATTEEWKTRVVLRKGLEKLVKVSWE